MRIVHTESSCGWGGQEIRILSEAEGMLARGHEVTLLCPLQARIFSEAARRNAPAIALPIARKRPGGMLALRDWLRNNPSDVVNTHSSTDSWLTALAVFGLSGVPAIVRTRHISATVPNNAATRWLNTRATRHIVTTGEKLRRSLIEHNGYEPARVTSIPTGIDTAAYAPVVSCEDKQQVRARLGLKTDGLLIGIVATLRSWKGHRYLLEAFSRLDDPSARLLIVGDGPGWQPLKQQAAELGLEQRLYMPGNQRDVRPWLQAMDVFALPSYANEGVPQALMQAMASGVPVVTTAVGSIPELVAADRSGLIVPPRDVGALLAGLRQLAGDTAQRQQFAAAARAHVLEHYGLERMLDRMEAVFHAVTTQGA